MKKGKVRETEGVVKWQEEGHKIKGTAVVVVVWFVPGPLAENGVNASMCEVGYECVSESEEKEQ
jgi:hypothetical protein